MVDFSSYLDMKFVESKFKMWEEIFFNKCLYYEKSNNLKV